MSAARCGTPSGYRKHQANDEMPCPACTLSKKEYDKRYRSASPAQLKNRRLAAAQHRATKRLANEYPDKYRAYYEAAKAEILAEQAGAG